MIILLLGIDIAKREKFNALHFLVFLGIGMGLMVFTFFPGALDVLGNIFGLQRWADLLVYLSIIFLIYFVLLLLRKLEHNKSDITTLIREIAIQNAGKTTFHKQEEIFVIPAYNEWEVIQTTIQTVLDAGYKNIIVVNDGSKDNSREILEKLGNEIISLHHYKNRGQWAALETGFEYVRRYGKETNYIVTFDSDGQHNIKDVETFRKYAKENPEIQILLGSRFLKESSTNISTKKKIFLKLAILFTFFLSNIKLSDTHNGYRYIKFSALKDIKITIDGMGHASEIIDIVASKKLTHKEVPVEILYTEYSLSKGQRMSNAFNVITRFVWTKFFK